MTDYDRLVSLLYEYLFSRDSKLEHDLYLSGRNLMLSPRDFTKIMDYILAVDRYLYFSQVFSEVSEIIRLV